MMEEQKLPLLPPQYADIFDTKHSMGDVPPQVDGAGANNNNDNVNVNDNAVNEPQEQRPWKFMYTMQIGSCIIIIGAIMAYLIIGGSAEACHPKRGFLAIAAVLGILMIPLAQSFTYYLEEGLRTVARGGFHYRLILEVHAARKLLVLAFGWCLACGLMSICS